MLLCTYLNSFGNEVVTLNDNDERYDLIGSRIDLFEDKENKLTINEISSPAYANKFKRPALDIPSTENKNSSYWIRFTIKDFTSHKRMWLIEFLDFRLDEVDFYVPDGKGGFQVFKGGDSYKFDTKKFKHKNYIFNLELPEGEQTCYARFKALEPTASILGEIETQSLLTQYSLNEYFLLALFYGVILALGLFNIFIYSTTLDRAYLYYVFYILCVGLYSMTQDGLGFQYLWPNHPGFNNYAFSITLFAMVFWVLMYARSFLSTKNYLPIFDKIIIGVIAARAVIYILAITFVPYLLFIRWIDVIPMFLAYLAGILVWNKGYKPARYYVIGFTFLFGGFFLTTLNALSYIPNTIAGVYGYHFGVLGQMFLLSFALAHRIRTINKQKAIVEEKNRELDIFVSKASHDIKGPLKSIIGLTKVGAQDIKSPEAKTYFDLILKNTKRLDAILSDLIMVTRVKQTDTKKSLIDFDEMIKEILASFEYLPTIKEIDIKTTIHQEKDFYSDSSLLYSVFQNMIENAIKYKKSTVPLFDQPEERSFLHIDVAVVGNEAIFKFIDNGLGIRKELQPKIFDMFFRVDNNVSGSGLGLYLVKISIEKIGGTISLDSEEGEGSVFTIRFRN